MIVDDNLRCNRCYDTKFGGWVYLEKEQIHPGLPCLVLRNSDCVLHHVFQITDFIEYSDLVVVFEI